MENAADALKMAAAVLIFVMALTISINAFTEVRQTSQIVLDYKDREYSTEYIGDNETETERIVSAEAIIPAIYKAYAENYKIVFDFINPNDEELYKRGQDEQNGISINYIDLRKEQIASEIQRRQFIQAILYGYNNLSTDSVEVQKIKDEYKAKFICLTSSNQGLYQRIINKKFKEELGVYYEEETYAGDNTPTANKNKKRIITYTEIKF